jgi:DNA-binding NarL/FixJ family response regulator
MMETMDILLVDDHAPIREEMISLLEGHEDLHVVGQATGGKEGVIEAARLHPDLILMDVVMPGMNGIEATRAIRASDPKVLILALSNHTGRDLVKAALNAGASGYVRKDQAYEEIIPAIRAVAEGKQYIGARVDE